MKILLTGGTGFLGSRLLRALLKRDGFRVSVLKRTTSRLGRISDALNCSNVEWFDIDKIQPAEIFAKGPYDVIIHCATNYGRGNVDMQDIVGANLVLPLTLLQFGIKNGVRHFINTDTVIDKRVNYYSLSKKQFLEWLRSSSRSIGCVNLALEHFYGPCDDESKFTTMVFRKLLRGEPSIDLTAGEQKRHFIHVDDVVGAFIVVLDNLDKLPDRFNDYQVSTEKSVSIRDFVTMSKELSGNTTTELKFGVLPYRENELMDSNTDISGLQKLGWSPRIDLESGIKSTFDEERQYAIFD